ncbi:tRNA1(Val) (adenine(37)-N6)-methyltransferase [Shewanella aestuarii]|uniref:tRNA1(Val) (adenine(37)-N6)-methyltransferase n=1 Tax=Shewanella aestuarii TaxID=1028752 RepID=A0A6G9QNX1_9GAMM|nr:methyltransferase [Shewanella aestuarii]QIR15521.1 methyltransferase [Shewanella aestuarii]
MPFTFKQFHIDDSHCGMRVSTDGVLLGAWANLRQAEHILDIGAGSGLLSLMTAQRTSPTSQIIAIEIDKLASVDCQINAQNSPWAHKITVIQTSIQHYVQQFLQFAATSLVPNTKFDHIICNPPYFSHGPQTQIEARATARHTNHLSFDELALAIYHLLSNTGEASLIIPYQEEIRLTQAFNLNKMHLCKRVEVSSVEGKPANRLLMSFMHGEQGLCQSGVLNIRDRLGYYSPQMANLCQDFYLKL